jgi:hypothetical protein
LKIQWKREECAHCDERPGGHQNTIWCAECFEWWVRESEQDCIRQLREELQAAQAFKARAIEALNAIKVRIAFVGHPGEAFWELDGIRMPDWREELQLIEAATDTPALAWLAQRDAEVAAKALEDIAKESGTDGGKAYFASVVYREFPDRLTMRIGVVEAGDLMMRAAALRAGATGGADA